MKTIRIPLMALALISTLALGGCSSTLFQDRTGLAQDIASKAWMAGREIPAEPFALTAFERVHKTGSVTNVYIEGDGLAWISKYEPSRNPTPKNPVALKLAAQDKSKNVIYLARPCQYSMTMDPNVPCDMSYWTDARYAPEVLEGYNTALNELKQRYDIRGFHLIGFSGGATVATLLAGQRRDIISIRSVAGNLDHRKHSEVHNVSYLSASLNPLDYAQRLARVPQHHFIGEKDTVVPKTIFDSYTAALPSHRCVSYTVVKDATHEEGWEEKWSALVRGRPRCK